MHTRMMKVAMVAAMVACAGGTASRAAAQDMLIANVPFAFTAAGRAYDAGKYELLVTDNSQMVELMGPAKNTGVAEVITRIAEPVKRSAASDGRLVFDKMDGKYVLSEMWLPQEEGYLLHTTPTAHSHETVTIHRGRS